jgi:hypothetical protein
MTMGAGLIERWSRIGTPPVVAAWQFGLGRLVLLPVALSRRERVAAQTTSPARPGKAAGLVER